MEQIWYISNQLKGYAEEAASAVNHIAETFGFPLELAAQVVAIAAQSQQADCLQFLYRVMMKINEGILTSTSDR